MRKISYAINSYHKTASIWVEYTSPLIFFLDRISEFICGYLVPSIPLPNFTIVKEREKTTVKDYYGDLKSLFHCHVHSPISNYCWRKTDSRMIEIDYDKARRAFYDKDKKFWDEHEESVKDIDTKEELNES